MVPKVKQLCTLTVMTPPQSLRILSPLGGGACRGWFSNKICPSAATWCEEVIRTHFLAAAYFHNKKKFKKKSDSIFEFSSILPKLAEICTWAAMIQDVFFHKPDLKCQWVGVSTDAPAKVTERSDGKPWQALVQQSSQRLTLRDRSHSSWLPNQYRSIRSYCPWLLDEKHFQVKTMILLSLPYSFMLKWGRQPKVLVTAASHHSITSVTMVQFQWQASIKAK